MRKLIWFTLGFGAACVFCACLWIPEFLILPLLVASVFLCVVSSDCIPARAAGLVLLGISAGIFWFSGFQKKVLDPVAALDGVVRNERIRCVSYCEKTDYGICAEGRIRLGDRSYPVRMYLDEEEAPEPGVSFSGNFRFQVTLPGGGKESSFHQGEGIFLLAYQQDELVRFEETRALQDMPAVLRQSITRILENSLPEDVSAFGKALLLGDTSGLDYGVLTNFTVSGIRHVIAVSGLHVSVLFGLLAVVSFRKRFLTALLAFPALAVFAAMTGFTPSVCRACIMCGLMMLASLTDREYDGPTALAFSGLVLLLVNPLVIGSVGFQLSFVSVAGIFVFTPVIQKWLRSVFCVSKEKRMLYRFAAWISLSVSVTLGATAATLPLCAAYFGTVSLAAPVTNILVLWAVSFVFYGLTFVTLLGFFWGAGAAFCGKILAVLIRYILGTAKMIAAFPQAAVYTRSIYIASWLVFVYVLLAAFLLSQKKKPAVFCCCIALSLCAALIASWTEPMRDEMRFTVLDVGQGQCLLFQSEGSAFLVDCGGSNDTATADAAAEALLCQGISKLDGIILTHYDEDHAGGTENLLSRIPAKLLILPPVPSDLMLEAEEILYARDDILLSFGNTKIHIFASKIQGNRNENSLCILFDTDKCDILVTGDRDEFAERLLMRRVQLPDVDVLIAGHHGARDSTSQELLNVVSPEIVCISAGVNNRFGHPAPELLERLKQNGCTVYRTDLHGDIIIRR